MARVLLIEDDPDQLEIRRLLLHQARHTVFSAASAAEARALFAECRPDTVVMDLLLPRAEDGLELIRWLKETSPGVRILVLSGWTTSLADTPELALVERVLAKPVRSAQLMALVKAGAA